jgi:hypothetical protein
MGISGPIPKRSDRRLGHLHESKSATPPVSTGPNTTEEKLGPEPPEWLDGFARDIYESFRTSGQSIYYAPSDWALLAMACRGAMEFIRRPSAMMLSTLMSGFNDLLGTEGSRRRVRVELERLGKGADPDLQRGDAAVDKWQGILSAVPDVPDVAAGEGETE